MRSRVIAAVVAVQVTIPVLATVAGVPGRFGFHMYSGQEHLAVVVTDRAGQPVEVDHTRLVARVRYELDWSQALSDRICDRVPEAHRVTVSSGDRTRSRTC